MIAGDGVFFAAEALVGVKKRCWRVGVSCARAMARDGAAFSSVTDAAVCKRLPRVRGRWRCVFTSRSASGIVAARCEVLGGAMPCDASATPGGLRCWCRVEADVRWKEMNSVDARSGEGRLMYW